MWVVKEDELDSGSETREDQEGLYLRCDNKLS